MQHKNTEIDSKLHCTKNAGFPLPKGTENPAVPPCLTCYIRPSQIPLTPVYAVLIAFRLQCLAYRTGLQGRFQILRIRASQPHRRLCKVPRSLSGMLSKSVLILFTVDFVCKVIVVQKLLVCQVHKFFFIGKRNHSQPVSGIMCTFFFTMLPCDTAAAHYSRLSF